MLHDCVSQGSPKPGGGEPQQPPDATAADEGDALLGAFQKLYCLSTLVTMNEALSGSEQEAEALLAGLSPAPAAEPHSDDLSGPELQLLAALNGAEIGHEDRLDNNGDRDGSVSDSEAYEPLEAAPHAAAVPAGPPVAGQAAPGGPGDVEAKLLHLSAGLSFHLVASPAAWQDKELTAQAGAALGALRRHPSFLRLLPAAGAVCGLVHDRIHSSPGDLEEGLEAVTGGLDLSAAAGPAHDAAAVLALGVVASLCRRLPQGPSRRRLWTQVKERWVPEAAAALERREAARAQRARRAAREAAAVAAPGAEAVAAAEEERHVTALAAALAEFLVTDAPPSVTPAQLQETLLGSGLFRSLVLDFARGEGAVAAAEGLRRALLACRAACPGLEAWARAVPGFSAAWEAAEFGAGGALARHGAVHAALAAGGDAALATCLESDDVPTMYETLVLLDIVHRAAARSSASKDGPRALWGPATDAALAGAAATLRGLSASGHEGQGQEEDEEAKLEAAPAERAAALAERRARLLQPECLRLIKGLRAKPGSLGKAD